MSLPLWLSGQNARRAPSGRGYVLEMVQNHFIGPGRQLRGDWQTARRVRDLSKQAPERGDLRRAAARFRGRHVRNTEKIPSLAVRGITAEKMFGSL